MLAHVAAAALICLDPGHGTLPRVGAQTEPIGPRSPVSKIKDPGGAPGEGTVALEIAFRTRALLRAHGYRVAMTRTRAGYAGGNVARAKFCNARHAALMLRIHADGSASPSSHGISTLYPALHRGWTDDVYASSLRAARDVQRALVRTTGARDLGPIRRADLTGLNWANVPAILVETGFLSNPRERALLHTAAYQQQLARGLVAGVSAFVSPRAA
jgi:N-acetylmuramoyl-L-alanine amidase